MIEASDVSKHKDAINHQPDLYWDEEVAGKPSRNILEYFYFGPLVVVLLLCKSEVGNWTMK